MDFTAQLSAATRLIDSWLTYKVYSDRLPGLAIGIVHNDQIIFTKGYGYTNLEAQTKTTDTTSYRIASFSKIFTTIAILQLFEQGKLHLDDPITRYLPWCQSESDPETATITIRQLLTHTSGLDRDGVTPHWIDFQFPNPQQIQQHIAEGAMTYQPAEKLKYSNLGFTLLGDIVSAVSATSYESYVTEHIINRLGLEHTAPTLTEDIIANLATGYSRALPDQERKPLPTIDTHAMNSATGFASSIRDLCQFMLAQFDGDSRLLRDETKREMRRIQWLREGDNGWCLGYSTSKINQQRIYGHGGSFPGYKSRFELDPDRKIGVVILSNAIDALSTDMANQCMQIIDHIITHYEGFEQSEHPVEQIERYEGTFRSIWDDETTVAISNSLLLFSSGSPYLVQALCQLRHDHDHQFTMITGDDIGSIGEPVRFELNDQGRASRIFVGANPSERFDL